LTSTAKAPLLGRQASRGWWSSGKRTSTVTSSPARRAGEAARSKLGKQASRRPAPPSGRSPWRPSNGSPSGGSVVVDDQQIPLVSGPVDRIEAREALAQPLELGVHPGSSGTSASGRPTSRPLYSPEPRLGPNRDPRPRRRAPRPRPAARETLSCGSPTGETPVSRRARSYHSGNESRSAWFEHRVPAEPLDHKLRWHLFPCENPGIFISPAIAPSGGPLEAALNQLGARSPRPTRTRESPSSVDGGPHPRAQLIGRTLEHRLDEVPHETRPDAQPGPGSRARIGNRSRALRRVMSDPPIKGAIVIKRSPVDAR